MNRYVLCSLCEYNGTCILNMIWNTCAGISTWSGQWRDKEFVGVCWKAFERRGYISYTLCVTLVQSVKHFLLISISYSQLQALNLQVRLQLDAADKIVLINGIVYLCVNAIFISESDNGTMFVHSSCVASEGAPRGGLDFRSILSNPSFMRMVSVMLCAHIWHHPCLSHCYILRIHWHFTTLT